MKKCIIFMIMICAVVLSFCSSVAATDDMNTTNLTNNRHVFINVSNDNGVKYDTDGVVFNGPNGTYYIKADGGGMNQLHITNNMSNAYGQVTVKNSTSTDSSGVFYITTTGGRGYNDEIILLLSVKGPISDNFSLHITSSGYTWMVTGSMPTITTNNYITGINETFTKSDFQYGPQIWKPGPGGNGIIPSWTLPLYYGQNTSDPSTAQYLMFIDLYVGNINSAPIDNGQVKVEYSFTGMTSIAAFNAYAWCGGSNQGQGISWAQQTSGISSSGYTVNYTPITPVANFTANNTSGSDSLTVKFTDNSANYPTSWLWDFGDGKTATEQNPTHTYSNSGNYTVKLTASNPAGNNTLTKTSYITVLKSNVYVQITPSISNPKIGDTVTYKFKLGNSGLGDAKDVVFTYVIPEGVEFAGASVDQGNYTYNSANRTLTWHVGNVPANTDPYLWLNLNIIRAGSFNINPIVTVSGVNIGSEGSIDSLVVNAVSALTTVSAYSSTIPMQNTGMPLVGLISALLLVGSGLALSRKK